MSNLFFKKITRSFLKVKIFLSAVAGSALLSSGLYARDIAFFYALDADYKSFASKAQVLGNPTKLGRHNIQHLRIGAENVYAIRMGSGTVETAVSAATLLTKFPCDLAFSVGPVGTLDDTLPIASWHKVGLIVSHQKGAWTRSGFQMGRAPSDEDQASTIGPANDHSDPFQLPALFDHLDKITVASGELFVASTTYRHQLRVMTGAQTVDMNLYGLETVCQDRRLPLFSWRIVSDHADDDASEAFKVFIATYRGDGGSAIAEIISKLPPDKSSPDAYPEIKRLLDASKPSAQ